ncbi:thiamine-phosphate kinase [Intrasporangium sp. DVR]|uniref:thiamine-phosphate kinase n=1 Tax=Intrasporangium sp. DVR TaxID=3127867 RepID=UPI00313A62DE
MSSRPGPSLTGGTPLRGLDEEEVLGRILPLFRPVAGLIVPPGDDAAVMSTEDRTIVTTDTVVLGRDWLDAWSSGADVGTKVVAQNLADVAAMGGRPTGVLVTLVADPMTSLEWVVDLARGIADACDRVGVAVLGGDLSSAPPGVVMVSVTALGNLADVDASPVLRSGARPGDRLAVRGSLGLAAAGLHLLMHDRADRHPEAVAVQRRPTPPLEAGPQAAAAGASAMLDVSDGLMRDGGRIARASGVVLELDRRSLGDDVARIADAVGEETAWDCVLAGGEEHSLLATFPRGIPTGWRVIGAVRAPSEGEAPGVLIEGRQPRQTGWDHFRNGEGRRP